MKKTSILLLVLFCTASFVNAQTGKYYTRTAHVDFYSHTPMEDIKADNNQVSAILDITNGEFAFTCLIKSFEFPKALMQEHFNENYMESDKFPKSTFKGKIKDLSKVDFNKDGEYAVTVVGNLTIKDKTNNIEVPGTVIVKDGKITAKSKFKVRPEDYNVNIPALVKEKIAKEIEVNVDAVMEPYKK
jgi:hypothetical protein